MDRTLILRSTHLQLNASLGTRAGAELVLGYGDVATEYGALLETAGLADRSHRAILRVAGPEAKVFLHGLVTNDVKGVPPGRGNYTAVVNARGKMLGDGRLLVRSDEELLLDLEPESHEQMLAHLDQHLISEDCMLQDLTGALAILGVYGPAARTVMELAIGVFPETSAPFQHHTIQLAGTEAVIVAAAPAGIEGFELLFNADIAETVWAALVEASRGAGGTMVGDEALDAARIHRVVPRYGAEMNDATIPLEANLEAAISYTKGCYVGQEVIAKATYRGRVRRKMGQLEVPPGTRPGASLVDEERVVGTIASVLDPDPAGGAALALAYLRPELLVIGGKVGIEGGGEAEVRWAPPPKEG